MNKTTLVIAAALVLLAMPAEAKNGGNGGGGNGGNPNQGGNGGTPGDPYFCPYLESVCSRVPGFQPIWREIWNCINTCV